MKKLELKQLENIIGSQSDTGCTVAGFMAGITLIGGIFSLPLLGAAAIITTTAGFAGCFD